ncbi:MAG: terpene cyclase/mutase family protein [Sedimentisphaerales bacterium]|nr:terpene cyclase/mutase family protein [Sedimentisphaerales bacterium]
MTVRLDMRRTVNRACDALGESVDVVRTFLRRQLTPDGGLRGRDGRSDLYYTVFGLEASLELGAGIPCEHVADYLDRFGNGESLDFVHLACLARCKADLSESRGQAGSSDIAARLQPYKAKDGGFSTTIGAERGSAYATFLALGACQDLGAPCPEPAGMVASIQSLQMPDGGYANEAAMTTSATPATAAAVCVLHYLGRPVPETALRWLQGQAHPQGGFGAFRLPTGPTIPDLLSTATALHALSLAGTPVGATRERHLDYLDSLWTPQGGFRGHWGDDVVDCEYTYYGLLSLGCLAT